MYGFLFLYLSDGKKQNQYPFPAIPDWTDGEVLQGDTVALPGSSAYDGGSGFLRLTFFS
jgi:hypothetical protein